MKERQKQRGKSRGLREKKMMERGDEEMCKYVIEDKK
jgi:hypothetical protein